jgi:hypothetical protein
MEKSKLLPVIAAIMITSMAVSMLSFSTTTVKANPGATVSPSSARANTKIMFTVTVTNDYASDNIDNVRIYATSAFSQPIGYAENLVIAADNMENAVAYITQAGENLILAEDNKKSSGPNIKAAADNLGLVTDGMLASENGSASSAARTNVLGKLTDVMSALQLVADAIDNSIENLVYVNAQLINAGTYLRRASGVPASPKENMENICDAVGENLDNAGADLVTAAASLLNGDFETAGDLIGDAGENLVAVGNGLTQASLKTIFQNAGSQLETAGLKLVDAGNFLDNAGYALGLAENYLTSAGNSLVNHAILGTAGANLKIAASLLENAGVAILDNVLRAGENLKLASDNLENVSAELGVALGKDKENAAAVNIDHAAENLRTLGMMGITTAGNELKSAATNLDNGAATMKSTANSLTPTTWTLTPGTNYVLFDAIGDNVITPGGTQSFVFLWTTPNITTKADYTISVLVSKEETTYTSYDNLGGFTLNVDGQVPTLTISVTQAGVSTVNLVGNKLDSAQATITIVASEALSLIDNVYVENSGQNENLLPPIAGTSFTTTDSITWVYQYITVDNWDDNSVAVRVSGATDLAGNENTADMENIITVDTRAPKFIAPEGSGLTTMISGMRENVTQAGTGTKFRYVDNNASKNIIVRVEDNVSNADNGKWVTSVTIDSTLLTKDPTLDNRWYKTITLSEGYNSAVTVTATDHTGNTVSENIENIFIDTQPPTITFNTITKTTGAVTWHENGKLINDNTPEINLTILDSGLGVAFRGIANPDNLYVYLDNNDNINDGTPAAPYGPLDNKSPWDVSTGVFENVIDNAGHGLANGTYWIIVSANDNLAHDVLDNDNWVIAKQSFTIDVSVPTWTTAQLNDPDTGVKVKDSFTNAPLGPTTKKTSWSIAGGARKPGSTINVYTASSAPVLKGTATAYTTINPSTGLYDYSLTIELSEGANQSVFIEEISTASNSSGLVLFGTYTVDATPPVIVLSAPAVDTTTDAAQITVSGTITDAIVTDPQTLIVTIDCTGASVAKTVYLNASGSFETTVPLVEGINKINVVAADGTVNATSGNQAITTRTVTRTVTPLTTYAIILVVVALILAAIAIFRKEMK